MAKGLLPEGWEKMDLLDVGVGDGYTIRLVKPHGEIAGIDFDPNELMAAVSRRITAKEGSAYDIPFPEQSFDVVTCFEVLEHLEFPSSALRAMEKVLRPRGYLVISTPVPNLRWRLLWWIWTKMGPGKKWEKIPHVSDLHVGKKSPQGGGLVAMLGEIDFEVLKTTKCNYGMVAGVVARKRG